jgi:putative ABC transport system permease protein
MKVFGCGRIISESLGISSSRMLYVGLGIGNALSALAGALITQISGTFSANMGNGSLVFGLAAVIIGEKIVEPKTTRRAIIGCFIGALIYKVMVEVATFGGTQTLGSEYNNVIIALVLIFLMALIQDSKKTHSLKNT